ncbi:MAG: hypothetical protein ACOCXX_05085 [Planctomycetota bacterium]
MSENTQRLLDEPISPESRAAYATQSRFGGPMYFVGSVIPDTKPPATRSRRSRPKVFRKILHFFVDHL